MKANKPNYEKAKIVCCAVALFLMISIIIINTILIVQIYILKEEVPNVCGYFPLISLEEESSIDIEKGDFIICRKFDEDIDELTEGKLVTHFADDSRSTMCIAPFVSVGGDNATLLSPQDKKTYGLPIDKVVGEYRFSIPLLGYIIYFLSTIPGFLICVVIPTIVLTEIYLYIRRKASMSADDEESILLAELEELKEERKKLQEQCKGRIPKRKKGNDAVHSHRGVRANAKRRAKARRKKR